MLSRITGLFPLWVIVLSIIAFLFADDVARFKPSIIPLLAVIMLAMGLTLTVDDFRRVMRRPVVVVVGVLLQFSIMPLAAWLISTALDLPLALMTGMILVGTSSGGTASNVICYLAKGDVALSITLTLCSTLLAVVAMPLLTWLYLNERIDVPVWDMLVTVLKIVLVPVLLGVVINHLARGRVEVIKSWLPFISMLVIVFIIAVIVAINHTRMAELSFIIIFAVLLHNLTGLCAGYTVARLLGHDTRICRTIAIEVGMQNSGLSMALAIKLFSPMAALPAALFSIWHNLSGSILAAWWSRNK